MGQSNNGGAPWPANNTANIANANAGSNSLSYGSLKNRFLSGNAGASPNIGAGAAVAGGGSSKGIAGTSTPAGTTSASSGKNKLFSLAR